MVASASGDKGILQRKLHIKLAMSVLEFGVRLRGLASRSHVEDVCDINLTSTYRCFHMHTAHLHKRTCTKIGERRKKMCIQAYVIIPALRGDRTQMLTHLGWTMKTGEVPRNSTVDTWSQEK